MSLSVEQNQVRALLRIASIEQGLNPDYLDAIGYVESHWDYKARNLTGSDGVRGGAWGPTQITDMTAKAHGYKGDIRVIALDPVVAAKWSAIIMHTRKPQSLQDAVAWWNAGRMSFDLLGPQHVTRLNYWPKAEQAMKLVEQNPIKLYV